ncbi:Proteasome assembly chaperone 2 [Cryptotermes secundus]|uniref:Proteasome assembly chaperone 2 n=1 Tax=Cryptotermes secundus TaxID=105785 RepID=A0A2J7QJ34_9NEOP|nr:proteasome assembly chaperone 2 isoform X3 [Cryptotermes secundus]PNF28598.1 Proteasome assembly chaperone 2 [Cryptotermes secundus]
MHLSDWGLQIDTRYSLQDIDMIHIQENVNLKGCTLIFPSVSVGNAAQLAVDLLITKIKPQKVGLIWHPAIMPLVGGDPYSLNETALTTSAEVFYSGQWKLVIFQIRSPIMQEASQDFVDRITEWIKENYIDKIVILSGIFDYTRNDSEIAGPSVKFVASRTFREKCDVLQRLGDQTATSGYQTCSVVICDGSQDPKKISMYGGGISWKFFNACNVGGIPAVVLMKYCSEGDNIPDAILLCTHLNTLLNFAPSDCNWESPPSWTGMFGNPPQHGLY